jgi:hypothetical protein
MCVLRIHLSGKSPCYLPVTSERRETSVKSKFHIRPRGIVRCISGSSLICGCEKEAFFAANLAIVTSHRAYLDTPRERRVPVTNNVINVNPLMKGHVGETNRADLSGLREMRVVPSPCCTLE